MQIFQSPALMEAPYNFDTSVSEANILMQSWKCASFPKYIRVFLKTYIISFCEPYFVIKNASTSVVAPTIPTTYI